MKTDKKLRETLSLYQAEQPSDKMREKLFSEVSAINIRSAPSFSLTGFLSGVIHSLTLWFPVLCAVYLSVILVLVSEETAAITLCVLTPFFAAGSVGSIYFNAQVEFVELESSCLYKPNIVFAGKMILCGICDLAAVIVGSVIASSNGGIEIKIVLILSLTIFLLSACVVMLLCIFFKTQTAMVLSFAIVILLSAVFLIENSLLLNVVFEFMKFSLQGAYAAVALLSVVLVLISFFAVKTFGYERLVKKYEA